MAGWGWDWFDKLVDFLNWFGTGIGIKVWQRVGQISGVPYRLPSEIITEILCRLPVTSLLRFRCVSKSWRNQIDDPFFIKLHLNHSLKTNTNLTLILTDHKANIFSVNFDTLPTAIKLDNPLIQKTDGDIIRVLGSCNGLIALVNYGVRHRDQHDLVVWNPSTRHYHLLPALPIEILTDIYESKFYGFGYDPVSDDYKLVRIVVYPRWDDQDLIKSHAKVYSIKSNSWRPTRDFPCCCYPLQRHGILVNNALHWMVIKKGEPPSEKRLVAFDLRVEEYFEVALPDYMDHFMCLKSLGGCLCVLFDYDELGVVLWVMKEYGVKESWIKLFSLVLSHDFMTLNPLAYSKSGDRVLLYEDDRYDEKFFWYDPKRKRAEKIRIQGAPKLFDVEMCVASLVPLMVGVEPMP